MDRHRGLIGGGSNSTALGGRLNRFLEALLKYYDLGITTFLIRGFDPLNDAVEYGKHLIPLTKKKSLPVRPVIDLPPLLRRVTSIR